MFFTPRSGGSPQGSHTLCVSMTCRGYALEVVRRVETRSSAFWVGFNPGSCSRGLQYRNFNKGLSLLEVGSSSRFLRGRIIPRPKRSGGSARRRGYAVLFLSGVHRGSRRPASTPRSSEEINPSEPPKVLRPTRVTKSHNTD